MDEKQKIEIMEIIECKNYFGHFVFTEEEKTILKDLYGLFGDVSTYDSICYKYKINEDLLNEITRTFENIKEELRIIREEQKKIVKKK